MLPYRINFDYPFWIILLVSLTGIIYSAILYYKNKKEPFSPVLTIFLSIIRFSLVACIALLLLNPFVLHIQKEIEKPILIMALDNSASVVSTKDSAFYFNELKNSVNNIRSQLQKDFQIDYFTFGSQVSKSDKLTFQEEKTDISALFREIKQRYINRNIGAIVLFSDGIINQGEQPLREAVATNFPVLTIGLGDTVSHPDLSVLDITANKKVFKKSRFTLETNVLARQLRSEKCKIELFANGTKLEERTIIAGSNNFVSTQFFEIQTDKPGILDLNIIVSSEIEEQLKQNNTRQILVEVVENKEKIMIWAHAPHPDIAALRASFSENYETEVVFGSDIPDIESLDLLILHQFPFEKSEVKTLENVMTRIPKKPVLFITGGLSSLNQAQNSFELITSNDKGIESKAFRNKSFSLFNAEQNTDEKLNNLPPLQSPFGNYNFKTEANILYYQKIRNIETSQPLIAFSESDNRKLGFIFGTGIWRWRLAIQNEDRNPEFFNHLTNQIVTYLLANSKDPDLKIQVKDSFIPSEDVLFKAQLFNPSGEPINSAEIKLTLTNDLDHQTYPFVFASDNDDYLLNAGKLTTGMYSWKAETTSGPKYYSESGKIKVEMNLLETSDLLANHNLLHQIASQTGGRFVPIDSLSHIPQWLEKQKNITSVARYHEKYEPVINYSIVFILLLILIGTEWFLRKLNGSY